MRSKKDINIEIGANIQTARERAGYTQERLSEILNITPNHMSAIERGASGISLESLQKLCRILGVSADFIIFGAVELDSEGQHIARQLASIRPEYRAQINKMLSALLELSAIMDGEITG